MSGKSSALVCPMFFKGKKVADQNCTADVKYCMATISQHGTGTAQVCDSSLTCKTLVEHGNAAGAENCMSIDGMHVLCLPIGFTDAPTAEAFANCSDSCPTPAPPEVTPMPTISVTPEPTAPPPTPAPPPTQVPTPEPPCESTGKVVCEDRGAVSAEFDNCVCSEEADGARMTKCIGCSCTDNYMTTASYDWFPNTCTSCSCGLDDRPKPEIEDNSKEGCRAFDFPEGTFDCSADLCGSKYPDEAIMVRGSEFASDHAPTVTAKMKQGACIPNPASDASHKFTCLPSGDVEYVTYRCQDCTGLALDKSTLPKCMSTFRSKNLYRKSYTCSVSNGEMSILARYHYGHDEDCAKEYMCYTDPGDDWRNGPLLWTLGVGGVLFVGAVLVVGVLMFVKKQRDEDYVESEENDEEAYDQE
eukprot:TRINITY_DN47547_c0_g1_i1.p1 TRINITY_DN47547_c0_g1~~TRINITY_DN47547_c0_g1_i1.p1  ORF type:complete len:456 (+),score=47.84 TRINITY_DN47547_c0_g1_i1:124-1368(+)